MKANLKGMQGVKGLLLKHCEKIGIAVVAVVAAFLVVRSMGLERLPEQNQPQRLDELVNRSRQQVQGFDWTSAPPEEKKVVVSFTNVASRTVKPPDYETSRHLFDAPVIPPTVLRTDPVLLAPQDLEVNVGTGLLSYVDEEVRRQRQLEMAREAEARQQEQERLREQDLQEAERTGRPGRGGRGSARGGGRGGRGDGREGEFGRGEIVDPEHPNRRPVVGRMRPAGVLTQGDERIVRAHWAAVVAKVPIEDQVKQFKDALEDAKSYRPGFDCPQYLGYFIERAEVVAGQDLRWAPLFTGHPSTINSAIKDWPESQPEVVDEPYVNPLLTFPLPPLVGRDWQYNATHSEIPLAADVVDEPEPVEAEEEQPVLDESDENFFTQGQELMTGDRFGRGGGRFGGRGGRGEMDYYRGMEMEFGGRGGGREYGGEYMGRGEMDSYGGRGGGGRGAVQASMAICSTEVPHLLFRFFDLTVQPGKRYCYRVRLVMTDVNAGVSPGSLDNAVIERISKRGNKTPVVYTDWSQPSPIAQIPLAGGSVKTVSAKPAAERASNSEPEVTMLVQAFDVDEAGKPIQAAKEKQLRRGAVANMVEEAEVVVENGRFIDEVDSFKFHTDIAVLDIQGGQKISRDLAAPARVLLMDSAGQLYVQNELEDFPDVDEHNTLFSEEETPGGRGFYDERGGRGEFGGRF